MKGSQTNMEIYTTQRLLDIQQRILTYLNGEELGYTIGTIATIGDIEFYQGQDLFTVCFTGVTIVVNGRTIEEIKFENGKQTFQSYFKLSLFDWIKDIEKELQDYERTRLTSAS